MTTVYHCVLFMYMYFLHIKNVTSFYADPQVVHMVKVLPANAGDARDAASILGWEDPLE